MSKRYIVEFDRESCIGAAACVAAFPKYWELLDDGKANLKGGAKLENNKKQKIEIDEADLSRMMESAQACPVVVIHIFEKDTGKQLI